MVDTLQQKLLIVDDDSVLQSFLQDFLTQKGFEVNGLLSGEEIDAFLQTNDVDLVLLDIVLPGKDGYHWLKWLQENHSGLPVLMLSVKDECDDRIHALELGANDYITKPADPRELLARINNLLKLTNTKNSSRRVQFGAYTFELERCNLFHGEDMIRLTTTESQLLKIFCENQNKTLSRDELTFKLRGNEHNPYDRSIDVHINRLRNKIETDPARPVYLLTTWGKGYRFVLDE